jgi:hypothetical protein
VSPTMPVDGECSQALIDLIKKVQSTDLGMKAPDGRIDPAGKTFKAVLAKTNPTATTTRELLFDTAPANTGLLTKVNPQRFRRLVIRQAGLGLTLTKGEDLLGFFKFLQNDPDIKDIRWAAYMLATVHKETEFSFKSNEEKNKGAGRPYGVPKQVIDAIGCRGPKNNVYLNTYYGRGYVHLTWENNYKNIGKAMGFGDELYINPSKALEPKIAYFVTSFGMRHGVFAPGNHMLSTYISGQKCDYKGARQIINGIDCDIEIADRAIKFEILLRLCA